MPEGNVDALGIKFPCRKQHGFSLHYQVTLFVYSTHFLSLGTHEYKGKHKDAHWGIYSEQSNWNASCVDVMVHVLQTSRVCIWHYGDPDVEYFCW